MDGELHWQRATDGGQEARWRVGALGSECTGSVRLGRSAPSGRLELSVAVERLDFARLLTALGLERPFGSATLGSLGAA